MNNSYKKFFLVIFITGLLFVSVQTVAAQNILQDIFGPIFGEPGMNMAKFYYDYRQVIDFALTAMIFISLCLIAFGNRFPGGSGKVIAVAVGLAFTFGFNYWMARYGYSFSRLGPIAAGVLVIAAGFAAFVLLEWMLKDKILAGALAYVITFFTMNGVVPTFVDYIKKTKGLGILYAIAYILALVCIGLIVVRIIAMIWRAFGGGRLRAIGAGRINVPQLNPPRVGGGDLRHEREELGREQQRERQAGGEERGEEQINRAEQQKTQRINEVENEIAAIANRLEQENSVDAQDLDAIDRIVREFQPRALQRFNYNATPLPRVHELVERILNRMQITSPDAKKLELATTEIEKLEKIEQDLENRKKTMEVNIEKQVQQIEQKYKATSKGKPNANYEAKLDAVKKEVAQQFSNSQTEAQQIRMELDLVKGMAKDAKNLAKHKASFEKRMRDIAKEIGHLGKPDVIWSEWVVSTISKGVKKAKEDLGEIHVLLGRLVNAERRVQELNQRIQLELQRDERINKFVEANLVNAQYTNKKITPIA